MCTILLPPGVNPIAVNKYIISSIGHTEGLGNLVVRQTQAGILPHTHTHESCSDALKMFSLETLVKGPLNS